MEREKIACVGAGRMGRGIAIVFSYAGHDVTIVDAKPRPVDAFEALANDTLAEVRSTLGILATLGLFDAAAIDIIAARVKVVSSRDAQQALAESDVIFEGVPEVADLKRELFARISPWARADAIIASTTSTILVDDLSDSVARPERFLNAHWLNPAYLVPLVELSLGKRTAQDVVARLRALLERVGKVPVICVGRCPGYIVPRVQTLVMNEAARIAEDGIASAEDIDKALKYGFAFRFSVLGVLEFIDWGGGDILYYASRSLVKALESERFAAPSIIERNMEQGRIGLRARQGFLDYRDKDIEQYRRERLRAFVERLEAFGLRSPPVL